MLAVGLGVAIFPRVRLAANAISGGSVHLLKCSFA